jgi:4-amino-4-deoxychorismate lyase
VESPLRRAAPGDLRLIETFRRERGGFVRLPAHLARMARGAAALGVRFDRAAVDAALAEVSGREPLRVRLTLALDGTVESAAAPLDAAGAPWVVGIAAERLRSDDPWLRLKTTARGLYDAVRAGLPPGVDEMVFLNERGEVCEGTITTVFADLGGGLVTPPLACGLLPGVLRAEMLARGGCREAVIGGEDLGRSRLFVGNSLRGLILARLAEPRA